MRDKTILITGVSRGLGLALARRWAADNTVIGLARTAPQEDVPGLHFRSCDLADTAATQAAVQGVLKEFPRIDLLINNAGILTTMPLAVMRVEDMSRMIDVNLKAPILVSKLVFRKMMQAKSGQIINILSMAARLNVIGDSVYGATKAGLEAFSKVLNKEGHPFGVHVNNIGLSAFPSGMLDQLLGKDEKRIVDMIPHKQYAPLEEVAGAIEFFTANGGDIGGQTLYFGGI